VQEEEEESTLMVLRVLVEMTAEEVDQGLTLMLVMVFFMVQVAAEQEEKEDNRSVMDIQVFALFRY
jgi:hypothetical protein